MGQESPQSRIDERITRAPGITLVRVRVDPLADDPFKECVEDAVIALLRDLRDALPETDSWDADPARVAVMVELAHTDDPWRDAASNGLAEAVRGVVGSITMELGGAVRLNTIIVRDSSSQAARDALDFLSSPGSGFVVGATFDLREN